jgi:hypothetical protein
LNPIVAPRINTDSSSYDCFWLMFTDELPIYIYNNQPFVCPTLFLPNGGALCKEKKK